MNSSGVYALRNRDTGLYVVTVVFSNWHPLYTNHPAKVLAFDGRGAASRWCRTVGLDRWARRLEIVDHPDFVRLTVPARTGGVK